MKPYNVYPLQNITIEKAKGSYVYDENGTKYLDFYGGHAVISIGHSHQHYIRRITEQLNNIGFYSNSVQIPIQSRVAEKLGKLSSYEDYDLFLCNSGAEANENALKLASFYTGKSNVISFKGAFHGRTSGAVAITDNPKIVAPFNANHSVSILEYDLQQVENKLKENNTCAVIYEPIQGVGSIVSPSDEFVQKLAELCEKNNVLLIADEVQSGYGRTGKFFAHQYSDVKPDIITIAKGMGNGFPIGGVLVSPKLEAKFGMLGTTFGGNHLACAAALAVLEVIESEELVQNSEEKGKYLKQELSKIPQIKEIRGKGLMVGIKFDFPIKDLRDNLLYKHHIFTGNASDPNVLRLLPSMAIGNEEIDIFISALKQEVN
ncbi:MAG: aspartate aminotransferase family protein [Flavobacteriales bacterium]|nr:aspartate aminotransferase family protein [Flavobacteriales bacterium]